MQNINQSTENYNRRQHDVAYWTGNTATEPFVYNFNLTQPEDALVVGIEAQSEPAEEIYLALDEEFEEVMAREQAREARRTQKGKGRHRFTREECSRGFWAAIDSIIERHPNAIMPDGRHMACNFLRSKSHAKEVSANV